MRCATHIGVHKAMTTETESRLTDESSPPEREPGSRSRHMKDDDLMNKYEEYRSQLKTTSLLALSGKGTEALIQNLHELETIYTDVGRSSSLRVRFADAQALKDTSNIASVNAKNIKADTELCLDMETLAAKFSSYLSRTPVDDMDDIEHLSNSLLEERCNQFNWLRLGVLFHKISNKPLAMEFLNGPIETEKRVRIRTQHIDDTKGFQSSTAQQVTMNELGNDDQNTSNLVRAVFKKFKAKQRVTPALVNFYKFFIDPESFSQSVENLFFTSFLVKDARVQLVVENEIPMIQIVDETTTRNALEDKVETLYHHIASFDYDTWEKVIQKYDVTESFLGHRLVEGETFVGDSESDDNSDIEDRPLEQVEMVQEQDLSDLSELEDEFLPRKRRKV